MSKPVVCGTCSTDFEKNLLQSLLEQARLRLQKTKRCTIMKETRRTNSLEKYGINEIMNCNLCPRNCNVDRSLNIGLCGTRGALVSRISDMFWEEPCISGDLGSGAVFFAGCNLKCCFCQNSEISLAPHGVEVSAERLADVFLFLQQNGVANINLITATHVSDIVAKSLTLAKPFLKIPIIYNCGGYEKVSAIKSLEGLVDVWLPDLKFCSQTVSREMCRAADYFQVATAAITEMKRQQPSAVFDKNGYIRSGLIIRHLVLPGFVEDTKKVLDWIAAFDKNIYVSLMSQYFPARQNADPRLNRRLFRHEYESACEYFFNVGLKNGYMQDPTSATADYVPTFVDDDVKQILDKVPHTFG